MTTFKKPASTRTATMATRDEQRGTATRSMRRRLAAAWDRVARSLEWGSADTSGWQDSIHRRERWP